MEKITEYLSVRFPPEVFEEARDTLNASCMANNGKELKVLTLGVDFDDESWVHDTYEEFAADYRRNASTADYYSYAENYSLRVQLLPRFTRVNVKAPTRQVIESVFAIFEKHKEKSKISSPPPPSPVIFVGHGRSDQWLQLKNHLQDKHGFKIEAYETGARAGHTIRDILEDMASKSTFALLVHTAEDLQADGGNRARQNVVHETGLFQGKMGFNRAIVLLEDGTEEFSNLFGIQQLRFSKGNIKEIFGDVLATIKREFG